MNRRSFLRVLGLGAAGAAVGALELDPERALWVPGQKTFFLPEPRIGMPAIDLAAGPEAEALGLAMSRDSKKVIDIVTKEMLEVLERNLAFAKGIHRAYDHFNVSFPNGHTVNVRMPLRFSQQLDPNKWET